MRNLQEVPIEAQWAHCYVYCDNPTAQQAAITYSVHPMMAPAGDVSRGVYVGEVGMHYWQRRSTARTLYIGQIPNVN